MWHAHSVSGLPLFRCPSACPGGEGRRAWSGACTRPPRGRPPRGRSSGASAAAVAPRAARRRRRERDSRKASTLLFFFFTLKPGTQDEDPPSCALPLSCCPALLSCGSSLARYTHAHTGTCVHASQGVRVFSRLVMVVAYMQCACMQRAFQQK